MRHNTDPTATPLTSTSPARSGLIHTSVHTYAGTGSTATFDDVAGTVTFEHTHWRQPKKKRAASPWTVPVAAIEGISWREATASKPAQMRLILRGRVGYNKNDAADLNLH
ncbi:DUF4429 domain-containing protein [Rhodococcus sp. LB1]|uniref:DUF4429 domain-containing protein n=1 Tax=Rhodococcus sp. LB1 TaxID=1807499 RepID=UPI0018D1FEE9